MNIKKLGDKISRDIYGGKAFWTNWLYEKGFTVPKTMFWVSTEYDNDLSEIIKKYFGKTKFFAIRSSATLEDGLIESKAGHYSTFLNVKEDEICNAIQNVVNNCPVGEKMGVMIQEMIDPIVSGVAFSSNPLNGLKNEMIISVVRGLGDTLVSGKEEGQDIIVSLHNDTIGVPAQELLIDRKNIEEIVYNAKKIESILQYPVDIEWCIDRESNKLYILQCRPITNLFLEEKKVLVVDTKHIKGISRNLVNSDKVRLRIMAEEMGSHVSKAYLYVTGQNALQGQFAESMIQKSQFCCGYSVVIIEPSRIEGEVVRSFVGDSIKLDSIMKGLVYEIVSKPKYECLKECISEYEQILYQRSWQSSIIIQEIYNPLYTGIMKKNGEGFIVEITRGHFASKGVVPMSTYLADKSYEVVYKNEIDQSEYIGIVEGYTLKIKVSDKESTKVTLTSEQLRKLIRYFENYFTRDNLVIEFGILSLGNQEIMPYLIDCTTEKENTKILDEEFIKIGVISNGVIEGKLIQIEDKELQDSLNQHFYNKDFIQTPHDSEQYIFVAKQPSIGLLNILNTYNPQKIGFIFESGSVLCHLAVLLREKNIPALVNYNIDDLPIGNIVTLDTRFGRIVKNQDL